MAGLLTFADFLKGTKTHKITSATDILNEAVKQSYLLTLMIRGAMGAKVEMLQGGSKLKDSIQLKGTGSFRFYSPHGTHTPADVDILTDIETQWRFCVVSYAFADEVMDLNDESAMEDVWVRQKKKYEQGAMTDMYNGMEEALLAVPVYATMESGTGEDPPFYSLSAFINEATNGVWPGWTNVETVNPSTESRWRPQQVSYDSLNPTDETSGIIAGFDVLWAQMGFYPPEAGTQWFQAEDRGKLHFLTHLRGQVLYKRCLRASNDSLITPQDPAYNSPCYSGRPVHQITQLATSALEITTQTTATGSAWPATKPRYIGLNTEFLYPIWHKGRFMEPVGPKDISDQPFSQAMYRRTWGNLFCRSRQRQGILYPAA